MSENETPVVVTTSSAVPSSQLPPEAYRPADPVIKDDAYWAEVRASIGRGTPSILLGTSRRSLDRAVRASARVWMAISDRDPVTGHEFVKVGWMNRCGWLPPAGSEQVSRCYLPRRYHLTSKGETQ